jgi:hypothetical protein
MLRRLDLLLSSDGMGKGENLFRWALYKGIVSTPGLKDGD